VRVLRELECGALQRVFRLHHAERHVETAQVFHERAELAPAADHVAETFRVVGGQRDPRLFGQVDDGLQAERAVEMNVQIRLRQ
jgi:hypothetical protein